MFDQAGMAFAVTLEDGFLRTMDVGRSWNTCNFGLVDKEAIALAISPEFPMDMTAVIAVASGGGRQARLTGLGASRVIDRLENDVVEEVLRLTDGRGADLVIDPVGSTLQASLSALAPEGRLVFVGNAGGGGLNVDLWQPMQKNQTLHGVFMGSLFEKPAIHRTVDELLSAAALKKLEVVIDRIFPLREAPSAHHYSETAKPLGRVVMRP
jgi:NADPH:quinone reductase-like Zn-dependent oxidoreductase